VKAWVFLIAGIVLLLVGVTWVLQGLGTLAGSFMSGQKLWFAIGLLVGLAGLTALASGVRRLSASRR
jgi:vacuolar-type H+-ATPase subunit I/STV1